MKYSLKLCLQLLVLSSFIYVFFKEICTHQRVKDITNKQKCTGNVSMLIPIRATACKAIDTIVACWIGRVN